MRRALFLSWLVGLGFVTLWPGAQASASTTSSARFGNASGWPAGRRAAAAASSAFIAQE